MIRLLFLGLLIFTTLIANEDNTFESEYLTHDINESATYHSADINTTEPTLHPQKILYLSFQDVPARVITGEVFSITIKTLSTIREFENINYNLSNCDGVMTLHKEPIREEDSKYFYDTFYFLATGKKAKLPDFTASLIHNNPNIKYKDSTLHGAELNVVTLNPKKEFSNIIADSFEIVDYKTTSYDKNHNIMIFMAKATNCDIDALEINNVNKQGIESIENSYLDSKVTYYAIIDKDIENFSFSYFNLLKNKYMLINIPIVVDDDSVTTQSDLKPKDQSRERLKLTIAIAVAVLIIVFVILFKKYYYLVLVLAPLAYIAYIGIPSKEICIKEGASIHLLPVENGTIFEITKVKYYLNKEGSVKNFVKVKLHNDKIGWVKNEDICKN